jgi:hypothetical protein
VLKNGFSEEQKIYCNQFYLVFFGENDQPVLYYDEQVATI